MIVKKTSGPKVPFKKEKKAILSLVILQIGFLVCWMPFIVVFPMVITEILYTELSQCIKN